MAATFIFDLMYLISIHESWIIHSVLTYISCDSSVHYLEIRIYILILVLKI